MCRCGVQLWLWPDVLFVYRCIYKLRYTCSSDKDLFCIHVQPDPMTHGSTPNLDHCCTSYNLYMRSYNMVTNSTSILPLIWNANGIFNLQLKFDSSENSNLNLICKLLSQHLCVFLALIFSIVDSKKGFKNSWIIVQVFHFEIQHYKLTLKIIFRHLNFIGTCVLIYLL